MFWIGKLFRGCKQLAHFFFGRLREVIVPLPDAIKLVRHHDNDELIDVGTHLQRRVQRCGRTCDNDARGFKMAAAQEAHFQFITSMTKPQIQKLLADKVLQMEFFEEKVHEVFGKDGRRFVLRRNPVRQEEPRRAREQTQKSLEAAAELDGCYA